MWHRGQDMTAFDEVAIALIANEPASEGSCKAVDRGYAVLEQMLEHPTFIQEKTGKKQDGVVTKTNWPYYGGATGHNTGYSPDVGPSEGKFAWRFPALAGNDKPMFLLVFKSSPCCLRFQIK